MTDIKTAFRIAFSPDALSYAVDEIERLNAENERLRELIGAWVDAEDLVASMDDDDQARDVLRRRIQTTTALRQAVGR